MRPPIKAAMEAAQRRDQSLTRVVINGIAVALIVLLPHERTHVYGDPARRRLFYRGRVATMRAALRGETVFRATVTPPAAEPRA